MDKRRGRYALALITSLSAVGIILVVYYRGESTDGDFLGPPSGRIAFSSPLILSVQENPEQLVVDDFNRDGRLDFAVANTGSHSISVFQNLGERDFLPKVYANIVRSPCALVAADLDVDGDADILASSSLEHYVSILTNDGDGDFTESGRVPSGDDTCNLATWDFDNDGYPDALVGDADSNRVSLFLNDHHYFTSAAEPIRVFRSFQPNMFFVEDVDRNGVPDIVIANEGAHTVTVLIASAPLNYGTEQIHTYVTGIEPEDVAPGDLNNDGFPDFVVGNYVSADLHVFINDRTGHFDRHTVYPAGRGAGRATVGDLNGDGFADVVVANYEDANIYLYFNRGDGRLLKPVRLRTGEGPGFLWIDDLDADGAADILVTNYISNDVYVFFGRPPAG